MCAKFVCTLARTRSAVIGADHTADMRERLGRLKFEGELILSRLGARFEINFDGESAKLEIDDAHSSPEGIARANALLDGVLDSLDLEATSRTPG